MTSVQKENCMKVEWTNRDNLSIETTSRNSKSILVIDTPTNCAKCKLIHLQGIGEAICNAVDWEERPSWCPLKPLPIKNKYKHDSMATIDYENDITLADYQNFGWNACLDEITGETE